MSLNQLLEGGWVALVLGALLSTFFTLLFLPIANKLFAHLRSRQSQRRERREEVIARLAEDMAFDPREESLITATAARYEHLALGMVFIATVFYHAWLHAPYGITRFIIASAGGAPLGVALAVVIGFSRPAHRALMMARRIREQRATSTADVNADNHVGG